MELTSAPVSQIQRLISNSCLHNLFHDETANLQNEYRMGTLPLMLRFANYGTA